MLGKTEGRQIEGEYQPTDLTKGADIVTKKFDECEKD